MHKQTLQQEQRQTLSARQIVQVKLLELPVTELAERIREEVIANPALESVPDDDDGNKIKAEDEKYVEDSSANDYLTEDDIPDYKLRIPLTRDEPEENSRLVGDSKSLQQVLLEQLRMMTLSPKLQLIAEQIIGNLGEDGYLRTKQREIEDYLLFHENVRCSSEEYNEALEEVQSLDPPGVAARDLRESLLLQLKRLPESRDQKHALTIVEDYFDDLGHRRYEKISMKMGLREEEFKAAQKVILALNPKPGNGYGSDYSAELSRVIPDFIVRRHEENFEVFLNEEGKIPRLRLNPGYVKLSEAKIEKNKELKEQQHYAKQQIAGAKWFMDALETRRNTLLRTMEVIVSLQENFFRSGDVQEIKPMILQDVARRTGHDVSTISRIGNEKWVQCEFGIYPLKFFFSEGNEREDGTRVSSLGVKAILKEIIDSEDKKKPFTDEQLALKMAERGYPLARRTLAKYREQLGILPARLRRKL